MMGDEPEHLRIQRVILLDPPPTGENLTVTLPDGTIFRPMELMVCPVCMGDYQLGKSETLPTKYLGKDRAVGVCPTCAEDPPRNNRRKLRIALGSLPWCQEGEEETLEEVSVVDQSG